MNGIFIQFYKHKEMVNRVIEGLLQTIDRDKNIIIAIDNLSPNSDSIRKDLKEHYSKGNIDKCYFMKGNYIFNSMREVVKDVLSKTKLDYIIISDGDVIPPNLGECWTKRFETYFDEHKDLGGMGFSTDLHHQTKEELKENAYKYDRVCRPSNLRCIKGTVPYYQSGLHFSEKYNKIDEDVIESLPMFQYYMIKENIISSYLQKEPTKTIGDGYISTFMLKNKYRVFRYESTPAKNMTYDSKLLLKDGYSDYKQERTDLLGSFHKFQKVEGWELLE